MEWIYLVLVAVVLIVGLGVLLVNRWRSAHPTIPPAAPPTSIDHPPPGLPGAAHPVVEGEVLVEETDVVGAPDGIEVVDMDVEVVDGPAVLERPTFRSRMAKARSALTGALLGVRSRAGITEDTWDDLEEALLRADVGIGVTSALLDPLRARVKAKEITGPEQLLGALQADMAGRLAAADRELHYAEPSADGAGPNVWLFIGVNGVGK